MIPFLPPSPPPRPLTYAPCAVPARGGSPLAESHPIFPAGKQIFRKLGLFLVAQC